MTDEPRPDHIELYRRKDGQWDYNVIAPNGEPTEGSMQGFTRRMDAIKAAMRNHPGLVVMERKD